MTQLSVSELTFEIKDVLEGQFSGISVSGEVSQPTLASSGHLYFTLKDAHAQISCVAWRGTVQRLKLAVAHGQQLILEGDVQVYAPRGNYQLIVSGVKQAGVGALQEAFEKLKKKLQEEGLFDPSRKKALPRMPMSIGVVTSETGAAFQDIRSTLERRWPMAVVKLYHAAVQGAGAAPEIVAGIERFARRGDVDVLIVGRGGGSLEDLWPFNEEAVARAIAACPIPVISAVGHETDFSISDFVADVRAATPTQSVVLATPDIRDLRLGIDDRAKAVERSVRERMRQKREQVSRLSASHGLLALRDKIQIQRARFDRAPERMRQLLQAVYARRRQEVVQLRTLADTRITRRLQSDKDKLVALHHRLETQNPETPLALGYVRVMQDGQWVRTVANFQPEHSTELVWKDGKSVIGNQ